MTDDTRRCRATTDSGERCDFRGSRDELHDHAAEAGHARCILCADALAGHERQTCGRCADRVRDDLTAVAVAFAHLERAIGEAAYRGIAWNQLAMATDGSMQRPMHDYETAEPAAHPLAKIGEGAPPSIRDEWPSDPLSVLAVLESCERDWRHEFGHGPAIDVATVASCVGYLRKWHTLAARTHPGFDDYGSELRTLRHHLEHAVGMADDPVVAPIWCSCADNADGGGRLIRWYAPADHPTPGLADVWTCCSCGEEVDEAAYLLRLRVLTELPGWVSMEAAARTVERPVATIRTWVHAGLVPIACSRFTRRTVVQLEAAQERSDQVGRVKGRTA